MQFQVKPMTAVNVTMMVLDCEVLVSSKGWLVGPDGRQTMDQSMFN